jgi:hypothetical protein
MGAPPVTVLARAPLATMPTLVALLGDRALLESASHGALVELRRQLHHLAADLDAAITNRAAQGSDQQLGEVFGVEEAAKRLDTSTDSLYRKHKRLRLGYIDRLDGRLKFTEREINDYVRRQRRD